MKLFIIGNGFDVAHGFKTRYSDFKEWMESKTDWDEEPDIINMLEHNRADGCELSDDKNLVSFLMQILLDTPTIGKNWWNFEESLHDLNLEAALDEATDDFETPKIKDKYKNNDGVEVEEEDDDVSKQDALYENFASNIHSAVGKLPELFAEWVDGIEINLDAERLLLGSVMTNDDLYLTFNYTETLENLYGISPCNVNHIHGSRRRANNNWLVSSSEPSTTEPLIIGHGNDEEPIFHSNLFSTNSVLSDAIKRLRKNTNEIINKNAAFWDAISKSDISDIYSFGFSYSSVDLPYIVQICTALKGGENATWRLASFDDCECRNKVFEERIKHCGFRGKFWRF